MLVGFNGAAMWMFSASHSFDLLRLLGLFALAILVTFLAEREIPYQPAWNQARRDRSRDVGHTLVNEAIAFFSVGLIPGLIIVRSWRGVWPQGWPLWAQVLMAIVVADLGITLAHYLSHRWAWLWRFHLAHHATERMYGLNGFIQHPLHQAFEITLGALPLIAIGLPRRVGSPGLRRGDPASAAACQCRHPAGSAALSVGRRAGPSAPPHPPFQRFGINFGLFTNVWDFLLRRRGRPRG